MRSDSTGGRGGSRGHLSRSGKLGIAAGLLLLSGVVLAQPGAVTSDDEAPAEADLQVGARSSLAPEDMLKTGTEHRKSMSEIAVQIEDQLEQARKDKDLIRVNCLTDKAIQARANLNVADKSFTVMRESIRRNYEGAAFDQYSRIAILYQNVLLLVKEANDCVGQDLSFVGATKVDVRVEGIPGGDPTQPPDDDDDMGKMIPEVTRPPPASPYL